MGRKAVALYTGGKDSHYALLKSLNEGYDVEELLIILPERIDSWLFHAVNTVWGKLHGELIGISYELLRVSGVKDLEVLELKSWLSKLRQEGFKYVISGVVMSNYQKVVIDRVCSELGMIHVTPVWGVNPYELLKSELSVLNAIIVAIQAYGLDERWLGEVLDIGKLDEFVNVCREYGINPVGEGGEFETFVISSPLFRGRRVCVGSIRKVWNPYHYVGYAIIDDAYIC